MSLFEQPDNGVEFIDPSMPFEVQQQQLERRKALLALALREQQDAQKPTGPEGEMVGRHYVGKANSQYLADMLRKVTTSQDAKTQQQAFDEAQIKLKQDAQRAREQWAQQRPQTIPGTAPPDDLGGGPPSPDREPSPQDVVNWAMKGASIPGLEEISGGIVRNEIVDRPKWEREQSIKTQDKADDRRAQIEGTLAAKEREIAARAEAAATQRTWQEQQNEIYKRTAASLATTAGGRGARDRYSVQQGADGKMYRVNLETNTAEPIAVQGAPGAQLEKPLSTEASKTQRSLLNLESGLTDYEKMIDAYDPQGSAALSPTERKRIGAAFTDMQMRLKEAYELGAITGPDMAVLSGAITDPTSARGSIEFGLTGKGPMKAQITEARKSLNRQRANFETQTGRPVGGAAEGGAEGSWAPTNTTPTPKAAAPGGKTVVREVKLKDGRTGVVYSDGTKGFK